MHISPAALYAMVETMSVEDVILILIAAGPRDTERPPPRGPDEEDEGSCSSGA